MTGVMLVILDDARAELIDWMPWVQSRQQAGVTFTQHRTPTPSCGPARAGLMSGQYALRTGIYDSLGAPAAIAAGTYAHDRLIAPWLTAAGVDTMLAGYYAPGNFGATARNGWSRARACQFVGGQEHWHYTIHDETGTTTEVDRWHSDYFASEVTDFIADAGPDWFVWWASNAPHTPWAVGPGQGLQHGGEASRWTQPDQHGTGWPSWVEAREPIGPSSGLYPPGMVRRAQIREVADLDRYLGEVWAHLDATGRAEDTTVIITSDSGVHWGEQRIGGPASKNTLYEASLRSPLVICGPGWPADTKVDVPTVTQDITATILAIHGATATTPQDGIDLLPVALDPAPWADRAVLCERRPGSGDAQPAGDAVVTAVDKLIHNDAGGADEWELYDLASDPGETHNLADDGGWAARRAVLEGLLDDLLTPTP